MSARDGNSLAKDRLGLFALGLYLAFTAIFFGRLILADPQRFFLSGGADHDPALYMWCLVWWPYAISHRLNPFFSPLVWAPVGANLAWVASIPGLALLAAPLTRALGPVETYNLLCLICPPLAGWAAFALCRHLTRNYWASLLGGYLFGFSPYMLGEMLGQLVQMQVFLVPLALLLVLLHLEGRLGTSPFVVLMAVLLAVQFSFALEVFATMTVFGAVALALAWAIGPEDWHARIRVAVPGLLVSYGISLVLVSPYLYHLFAFGHPRGPIVSPKGFSSDLANFLVPTHNLMLGALPALRSIQAKFPHPTEANAYIALPLMVIAGGYLRRRWNTATGRLLALTLGVLLIASLGPKLHVGGRALLGLPWGLTRFLPLINSALPARFAAYIDLAVAIIAAKWLSETGLPVAPRAAVVAAVVLFTLPNPDIRFWTRPTDTPQFFSDGQYRKYLAPNENVLVVPYSKRGNSMLWQAETGMYFRMAGGDTSAVPIPEFERWPVVNAMYFRTPIPDPERQLKAFLAAHQVGAIIIDRREPPWWGPIFDTLGVKPVATGGVLLYRVPASELEPYRESNPLDLEARFYRARFERLLIAAQQYRNSTAPIESLTPLRAEQMGLLPAHWAAGPDVYTQNGLWLGPLDGGKVGVGVVGSWEALKPLIDDYRADATAVYFPYPRRLEGAPRGDTFMRKLVMVFEPAGLKRAAARASAHGGNSSGPRDDVTVSGAVSPEASRRGVFR